MEVIVTASPGTDEQLWQRLKNNDEAAFGLLFKKYWKPLTTYAAYFLPDQSEREEVMQVLFMELFLKRHTIKIQSTVGAYLMAFAKNKILNYLRHQSVYKKHLLTLATKTLLRHKTADELIDLREAQERVHQALALMPDKYSQVFILNKEYQLSLARVAQLLKRPVNTVEKQLRKALRLLRDELRDLN